MENGRFLYFNENGKLDPYYILKRRYPVIKKESLVPFIECAEMTWKTSDANGLRVSILLKNTGWYLGVIGKLDRNECLQ